MNYAKDRVVIRLTIYVPISLMMSVYLHAGKTNFVQISCSGSKLQLTDAQQMHPEPGVTHPVTESSSCSTIVRAFIASIQLNRCDITWASNPLISNVFNFLCGFGFWLYGFLWFCPLNDLSLIFATGI